jgi:diacylglycerol kinase family enzyme
VKDRTLLVTGASDYIGGRLVPNLLDLDYRVRVLVRDTRIGSLLTVGNQVLGHELSSDAVKHWQGREIVVECDPPQTVQGDGEIWDDNPVEVKVLPGLLPILTLPDDYKGS